MCYNYDGLREGPKKNFNTRKKHMGKKAAEAGTQPIEEMSVEDLIALGFDRETAEKMTKYSNEGASGGIFAPILSFNYDKDDILGDSGVAKKGEFVSGYKVNRKALKLEEEGINHGDTIEFIVFASAYQYSAYDNAKNTTSVASNIFTSPFDAKKAVDMKSGELITTLKESNDKIKFANILGVLVNTGDEWMPFAFYSRGTNYYELNKQLMEEYDIESRDLPNSYRISVKSKKVPTKGNPAWVMDVKSVEQITVPELVELKDVISPNIKKFDNWVSSINNVNKDPKPSGGASYEHASLDEDDIDI